MARILTTAVLTHVEVDMGFSFLRTVPVACQVHGKNGLDEEAVNDAYQVTKLFVLRGYQTRGLALKLLVDMPKLFEATIVDGLKEAALLYSTRRCNLVTGRDEGWGRINGRFELA